jgi:type I restriction enzyme S subunit
MTASWSEVRVRDLGPLERIDAEYYDPAWLEMETALSQSGFELVPLGQLILDGYRVVYENTEILPAPEDDDDYVRFLQSNDISRRLPVINSESIGRVSRADWNRYPKGRIRPGELLIEVKGRAEKVAIVPEDFDPETLVTGTLFKATLDESQIIPKYLLAYLLSKYGRGLRTRCLTNSLIGYVSKPELYIIPVVLLGRKDQEDIAALMNECLRKEEQSRRLYYEAEQLLLSLLSKDARSPGGPALTYQASSRFTETYDRLDAEYYQPRKWTILKALRENATRSVSDFFSYEAIFWDPQKAQEPLVRNYDLADAFFPFLDDTKEPTPAVDVGSTKKIFQPGDVLVSRLRSYLRQVAIALGSDNLTSVASTEFIVLRSKQAADNALSAETLLLYLRSEPIQTVLSWSQDGSNHPRFDRHVITELPVPTAIVGANRDLTRKIRESIDLLRAAESSLSAATSLVEETIRRGARDGCST